MKLLWNCIVTILAPSTLYRIPIQGQCDKTLWNDWNHTWKCLVMALTYTLSIRVFACVCAKEVRKEFSFSSFWFISGKPQQWRVVYDYIKYSNFCYCAFPYTIKLHWFFCTYCFSRHAVVLSRRLQIGRRIMAIV